MYTCSREYKTIYDHVCTWVQHKCLSPPAFMSIWCYWLVTIIPVYQAFRVHWIAVVHGYGCGFDSPYCHHLDGLVGKVSTLLGQKPPYLLSTLLGQTPPPPPPSPFSHGIFLFVESYKWVLSWLPCQVPGIVGSVL